MDVRRFPFHASIPELLRAFHDGRDSPPALLERCFAAIDAHEHGVNALPTRVDRDQARAAAGELAARIARREAVGPLVGLPYCAKDTHATAGLRTTWGSPIFAEHVPRANDPVVQRVLDADAVLIAKSNTPEFAAGAQTFNPVFGATRHPLDPSLTVGGSSGGGAAALACGMTVVADGSDLGGSLRNPAGFCGVVGMRPSSTAEPALRNAQNVFGTLNQIGAMGARVADLRVAHRAIRAPQPRRPLAQWLQAWDAEARRRAAQSSHPLRLAWSIDCGGSMPVAGAVRSAFARAIERLRNCGVELVEAWPDLSGADDCFQVLRAEHFVENWSGLYETERARLKDSVAWNIAQGLALDVARVAAAARLRSAIFERVAHFVADFDAWLLPTTQVLPFPIEVAYPTEIDGEPLRTYIDWVSSCYRITVSGHPALTLPGGFAGPGPVGAAMPVGLQLVGRFGADEALLDVGERLETLLAPLNDARPALRTS